MTAVLTIDQPAYFDRLAEVEAAHWWSLGMWQIAAHWLDHALHGRRALSALDVGCGTGQTALRLSRRRQIESVVGLDPSTEALFHARRRHAVPLVRGTALALPFAADRFDVVTCFDVLQHLPAGNDRVALEELCRVLRPKGVVLLRSNARGLGRGTEGYRLGELINLVEASGLRVLRATRANCLPALAQELRGRVPRLSPRRPPPHPALGGLRIRLPHPWINRLMGGVSSAEAAVAGRLGARLPFGHSTMILARRGA